MEAIPLSDFVDACVECGYLDRSSHPELDSLVWKKYIELNTLHTDAGLVCYIANGIPFVNDNCGYNYQMEPIFSIPFFGNGVPLLPCKATTLIEAVAQISDVGDVATDSFLFTNKNNVEGRTELLYINSPVARLYPSWDKYLESLSQSRRYKMRRCYKDYEKLGLKAVFSDELKVDFDWCLSNLQKFGDLAVMGMDPLYWSKAAELRKATKWVQIFDNTGELQLLASFSIKHIDGEVNWVYNGIVRKTNTAVNNLGTMLWVAVVRHGIETGEFAVLDPTCKYSPEESPIDEYKRRCVNEERDVYTLASQAVFDENVLPPFYIRGKGWQSTPTVTRIYEGL